MSRIRQLETLVEGWMKPMPHLPADVKKWLADNVWWIVFIAAIASGISVLFAIGGITAYYNYIGNTAGYVGMYAVSAYAAGWIWNSFVSLAVMGLSAVLYYRAVTPLREHRKWGWDLMFIVLLLQAASVILSAILSFSIIGFIFTIIFGAIGWIIGAYLLYEVRSYFVKSVKREQSKI